MRADGARIDGTFYDGERSTARRAALEAGSQGEIAVELIDELGADGRPRRHATTLADIEVSDRVGSIPRRIRLAGIGTFETTDNEAVDRFLAGQGHASGLVHRLEQRWPFAIASLLAVALGSLLFVRFGIPRLADLTARALPTSIDQQIGARTLALLDDRVFHPTTIPEERRTELAARFASMASDEADAHAYRLELRAAPALGANAMALPSGIVIVTDGLVEVARDDDELVAVLAHEMGHVRGRHALRRLLRSVGVSALAFALIGDVSSASALFSAVPAVIDAKHSRDFEREADAFARSWLVDHGIGPDRFDEILCRIRSESGGSDDGGWLRYLATHPPTDERARCPAAPPPPDPA
jgi:Zn-dependent protease with chaperone function